MITRVVTPTTEAVLVDMAKSSTAGQLEQVVRGYRRGHGAEKARNGYAEFERRSVRRWDDDEGMVRISARLPAEDGAQGGAALRAYDRAGATPDATSLTPDWDGRPQDLGAAIEVLAAHADRPDAFHYQATPSG